MTVSGLTIAGGYSASDGAGVKAASIATGSRLTLNDCVVTNKNTGVDGCGIFIGHGVTVPDWTMLAPAIQYSPGQYQFTDPGATNYPQRFYQVVSP